jgi:hypothetical protein
MTPGGHFANGAGPLVQDRSCPLAFAASVGPCRFFLSQRRRVGRTRQRDGGPHWNQNRARPSRSVVPHARTIFRRLNTWAQRPRAPSIQTAPGLIVFQTAAHRGATATGRHASVRGSAPARA